MPVYLPALGQASDMPTHPPSWARTSRTAFTVPAAAATAGGVVDLGRA